MRRLDRAVPTHSDLVRLAWSNLYEIATQKGGNPSPTEIGLLESVPAGFVRMEQEAFRPRLAIFMVGWD